MNICKISIFAECFHIFLSLMQTVPLPWHAMYNIMECRPCNRYECGEVVSKSLVFSPLGVTRLHDLVVSGTLN